MPLKENIKKYRLAAHMTLDDVAKVIDVTRQTVQKYESGVIGNIPSDKIEGMAKIFDCSPADLMGWNAGRLPNNVFPIPHTHKIPVIGDIACGVPILAEENIEGYESCPDFIHADFCLHCKGDSMINARINDDDTVFIQAQPEVENGEIAAVEIIDGGDCEATLKRFYQDGNKVMLNSENPKYPPFIFVGEEINKIKVIGKAVYFLSKIK